ncbi:MAG: DUF7144 family membrane protein [Acidimicrobiales bacterium]
MEQRSEPTGWVGWITFAGIMLIIGGVFSATYGLIAIFNDTWAVWGNRGTVFLDLTQWGWVHLIAGVIVLLAGIGVMSGVMIARIIAVIVAGVSMILNFAALPIYPVWSILMITVDVLVIWALVVHGRELKA